MGASTKRKADDSLSLRKRNADMCPDEEEKEEDSCESDQAWGFDSFEDTDYDPDDTDDEDNDFEWNRYLRHVYSTRGFNVEREMLPKRFFQGVRPFNFDAEFLRPDTTGREYMDNMVKLALDRYNKENNTNVACDHVVNVMAWQNAGIKSYITFMARESPQGDLVEYQAKTHWKVWQRNSHAIFCRPTPPVKFPVPDKYFE